MSLTVRGSGKVKIVRDYQETDKFYRCFIATQKTIAEGEVVTFEFAIKLVGKALELAKELKDGDYLRILNAKLSNKKDDRFTSSYKKTQIVVYDAEIISEDEYNRGNRHISVDLDAEKGSGG